MLFAQTRFIFDYPLVVPSHLRPRFAYILDHIGHARSQGGRQPASAKPPLQTWRIQFGKNEILCVRRVVPVLLKGFFNKRPYNLFLSLKPNPNPNPWPTCMDVVRKKNGQKTIILKKCRPYYKLYVVSVFWYFPYSVSYIFFAGPACATISGWAISTRRVEAMRIFPSVRTVETLPHSCTRLQTILTWD